jgi:hypothetical protein
MPYLIGVGVALAVCVFALVTGFDRGRIFYATMVIVVAHYYILFAAMADSTTALVTESLAACVFIALAVVGFKKSSLLIAAGLAGHGVFDFFHHLIIHNPGVPEWWPAFCLSFDIAAGLFFAALIMWSGKRHAIQNRC